MPNRINYVPHNQGDLMMHCLECGAERFEAFQCTCGKKFCKSCSPDSFEKDEFGFTGMVTCPKCGAITMFV